MNSDIRIRAESLDLLTPRLSINNKCQDYDFQTWLQSRLSVSTGEYILDLACGNGAQSLYFSRKIGPSGYLRSVDIHEPSIAALKQSIGHLNSCDQIVSDMEDFDSYLDNQRFTLLHCSFALPYAKEPLRVVTKLAAFLQPPLGRLAISLPCPPHGMVDFVSRYSDIPSSVTQAIHLGSDHLIDHFRTLFYEVDVSFFQSNLVISDISDFISLYESTTYYSSADSSRVISAAREIIGCDGHISFSKCAILLIGRQLKL